MSEPSNASRTTRKPKGEGHSRRGEILAAAERIFVEHGYEGATIRKIADEVGLSSTALYMHFPDKGAILQEICRDAFARLIASNAAVADEAAPPEQRLPALYPHILSVQRRDRGGDWPDPALAGAETASRQHQRPALATVELGSGRYRLVLAAEPTAYALGIDLRAMVPWAEWPMKPETSPVSVRLDHAGQSFTLQHPLFGLDSQTVVGADYNTIRFVRKHDFGNTLTDTVPLSGSGGGEYISNDPYRSREANQAKQFSLFAENRTQLTERLSLITGARRDQVHLNRDDLDADPAAMQHLGNFALTTTRALAGLFGRAEAEAR